MSYTLKVWKDPYDEGYNITKKRKIVFEEGITVLVGCNGAGKTTLLNNIKEQAKKDNIPVCSFDNHSEDEHSYNERFVMSGDYEKLASMMSSSEGEQINIKIGELAYGLSKFLKTGKHSKNDSIDRLRDIFSEKTEEKEIPNIRFVLLDAVDSGLSIDNIVQLKELFPLVLGDAKKLGMELYIIVSANAYEVARNERCLDVIKGDYTKFKDYEDYREFVIKSHEEKMKRCE